MKYLLTILLLTTFSNINAQFGFNDKGNGHYWTKNGEKVTGSFKISYKKHLVGGSIIKHYVNDKKVGRLDVNNLQSLVINSDSFIVAKSFSLDNWAFYDYDIVEVAEIGKINLYIHRRKVSQSAWDNSMQAIPISKLKNSFIVSEDQGKTFLGIATNKQFKELFIPMISDNQKVLNQVLELKKRNWLDHLPTLIQNYNGG